MTEPTPAAEPEEIQVGVTAMYPTGQVGIVFNGQVVGLFDPDTATHIGTKFIEAAHSVRVSQYARTVAAAPDKGEMN